MLIDGHNLIGAGIFDDIRLSDEDDEAKLVARLKVWKSRIRGPVTVIFDRGVPGGKDVKLGGAGVEVIFAADPQQADDLIRRRLRQRTKGLILVTQDEALLREATAYGVKTWRGAEFVERLTPPKPAHVEPGEEEDVRLSAQEVEEWLRIFGKARPKSRRRKPDPDGGKGRGSKKR
jgi:predicted RNA-binding protein with PIN domain